MIKQKQWSDFFWDAWCLFSCVGIWPRFIEPRLLCTSKVFLPVDASSFCLKGLKIVQFSDLHWSSQFSQNQIKKLLKKIRTIQPDLICFTGDFLCHSELEDKNRLLSFLQSLEAPLGCFAILGNHDYDQPVCINAEGFFDIDTPPYSSKIRKGIQRFLFPTTPKGESTEKAKRIDMHLDLMHLLRQTKWTILHNETVLIPYKNSYINLCGLGDHALGRFTPEEAFKNYASSYPGIILSHNPDTIPLLQNYPGNLILSGHTHGGQINLPGIWQRLSELQYPEYKSGLKKVGDKLAYINRGIGHTMPFRWFAPPEITFFHYRETS